MQDGVAVEQDPGENRTACRTRAWAVDAEKVMPTVSVPSVAGSIWATPKGEVAEAVIETTDMLMGLMFPEPMAASMDEKRTEPEVELVNWTVALTA